jgi:glutamate synthase domain-containing protein 3
MNLNENNTVVARGNVADDCCDAMNGGLLKIFGDAGDVLGQALSGGKIYITGNVGNRTCIQMREYGDSIPHVVIMGKFDDYLGEYMAGGTILVLSSNSGNFGKYIGSGMLGGRIFIRGMVKSKNIGVQPSLQVKTGMLKALKIAGIIEKSEYSRLIMKNFIDIIEELPEDARIYARKYYSGHQIPDYSYRNLSSEEKHDLKIILSDFDREMGKNSMKYLEDKFTVIVPRKS